MSRHAGPPPASGSPPPPEPSFAERARTLVHVERTGALSTLSRRHPGHPFGSIMPYALDAEGRPLFLISTLAVHTRNLAADPRVSLLVAQSLAGGDPLAAGRVTLVGEVARVPAGDADSVRAAYLDRHPNAASWVDFGDFGFHRLEVADVYFVGGFGAMDWVSGEDYRMARPDPLAEVAPSIMEHMNRDHADALVTLARALARAEAGEARMIAVDRLGFTLRLAGEGRVRSARIPFPREVLTADDSRAVLIEMLRDARARRPS